MFDVNFYMKSYLYIQNLMNGTNKYNADELFEIFESLRDKNPYVYNIETTNACNMSCVMCPRTTKMTRPIKTLNDEQFEKVVNQIEPIDDVLWEIWKIFVQIAYGVYPNDMSENHFFLYIIPRVIQLHHYGEALLDKNIANRVKLLSEKNIESYFSCNPRNINPETMNELMMNKLSYIKFSIESSDVKQHEDIRGLPFDFKKIFDVLDIKKKNNYKTTVVITMLDLDRENQERDFVKLKEIFKGKDVYIYLKSQDCLWLTKNYHKTNSVHWLEICKTPFDSMTIDSGGNCVACFEDYNGSIILGNIENESLYDIWNGKKYNDFRRNHLWHNRDMKCELECDMSLMKDFL